MDSLPVLFEDSRFIAVDKPPGLLSIPGRDPKELSVTKVLKRTRSGKPIFVVHRIDRDTSGVLLLAKSEEAHRLANAWFSGHELRKEYLAIAQGTPRLPAFRVNALVEGKPSLSQFRVVERFPMADAFLARARIATGRRHQIRIHLAHEAFPILGDVKYGGPRVRDGIRFARVALHAELLVLPSDGDHPSVEIRAPLPSDFNAWLDALRRISAEGKP
jgi:RluA family pseudouridine synthase